MRIHKAGELSNNVKRLAAALPKEIVAASVSRYVAIKQQPEASLRKQTLASAIASRGFKRIANDVYEQTAGADLGSIWVVADVDGEKWLVAYEDDNQQIVRAVKNASVRGMKKVASPDYKQKVLAFMDYPWQEDQEIAFTTLLQETREDIVNDIGASGTKRYIRDMDVANSSLFGQNVSDKFLSDWDALVKEAEGATKLSWKEKTVEKVTDPDGNVTKTVTVRTISEEDKKKAEQETPETTEVIEKTAAVAVVPFAEVRIGDLGEDYNGDPVTIIAKGVGSAGWLKLKRYDVSGAMQEGIDDGLLPDDFESQQMVAVRSDGDPDPAVYTYEEDGVVVRRASVKHAHFVTFKFNEPAIYDGIKKLHSMTGNVLAVDSEKMLITSPEYAPEIKSDLDSNSQGISEYTEARYGSKGVTIARMSWDEFFAKGKDDEAVLQYIMDHCPNTEMVEQARMLLPENKEAQPMRASASGDEREDLARRLQAAGVAPLAAQLFALDWGSGMIEGFDTEPEDDEEREALYETLKEYGVVLTPDQVVNMVRLIQIENTGGDASDLEVSASGEYKDVHAAEIMALEIWRNTSNRWSAIEAEIKKTYPSLTDEQMEEVKEAINYEVEQNNMRINSSVKTSALSRMQILRKLQEASFYPDKLIVKGDIVTYKKSFFYKRQHTAREYADALQAHFGSEIEIIDAYEEEKQWPTESYFVVKFRFPEEVAPQDVRAIEYDEMKDSPADIGAIDEGGAQRTEASSNYDRIVYVPGGSERNYPIGYVYEPIEEDSVYKVIGYTSDSDNLGLKLLKASKTAAIDAAEGEEAFLTPSADETPEKIDEGFSGTASIKTASYKEIWRNDRFKIYEYQGFGNRTEYELIRTSDASTLGQYATLAGAKLEAEELSGKIKTANIDPEELALGTEVEMEHKDTIKKVMDETEMGVPEEEVVEEAAKDTAGDHIDNTEHYYTEPETAAKDIAEEVKRIKEQQ